MLWFFPFVRFGSLAVKPLCSGLINVILMRGQSYNSAGALRANALAEDAVRRRSPQVKASPGLLMPLRSDARPRHCWCPLTVAPCAAGA